MAFAAEDFDYLKEKIGELRIGLPEKEVKKLISCKPKLGKDQLAAADGEYHQTWKYADCGIELDMVSEKKGRSKSIGTITVTSPCTMQTTKGIRIGSTEQDVIKAYGRFKNQEDSEQFESFVAGSIYGGLIFDIKQGKVNSIFIGAGAE
jgi:hypothetical protein